MKITLVNGCKMLVTWKKFELRVHLGSAYFAETEKLFTENTVDKVKS